MSETTIFQPNDFQALIGIKTEGDDVPVRVAFTEAGVRNGIPDKTIPAVYVADWIARHWEPIKAMAASEYAIETELDAAKHNLRALEKKPGLVLVDPNGGRIQ